MDFDLLVRGGSVVDGSGAPAFVADVGVRRDRIAVIGALPNSDSAPDDTAVLVTEGAAAPPAVEKLILAGSAPLILPLITPS